MKKLLFVVLLILVGCGSVDIGSIDEHLESIKAHAETAGADQEGYINELESFNEFLEGINDEDYQEYISVQIEANNMRIEALETDNSDLITSSSLKQAQALQILDKLKESK